MPGLLGLLVSASELKPRPKKSSIEVSWRTLLFAIPRPSCLYLPNGIIYKNNIQTTYSRGAWSLGLCRHNARLCPLAAQFTEKDVPFSCRYNALATYFYKVKKQLARELALYISRSCPSPRMLQFCLVSLNSASLTIAF